MNLVDKLHNYIDLKSYKLTSAVYRFYHFIRLKLTFVNQIK